MDKKKEQQLAGFLQHELNRQKEVEISENKAFFFSAINWIREMKFLLITSLRLTMAIKLADKKFYINDKRYWILPDRHTGGMLTLHEKEIDYYKKLGVIDKNKGALELAQEMFYRTPTKRGSKDGLSKEEKADLRRKFIKWQRTLNPIFNKAKVGAPVIKSKSNKRNEKNSTKKKR